MTYLEVLHYIEKKMGRPPRRFYFWHRRTWLKQDYPGWDWQNDDIKHSILNWEKCFKHGQLTWGLIVQVNKIMFDTTQDMASNCPGEVVIWTDDLNKFDEVVLGDIADALYALKGNSANIADAEEKQYAQHLENEMTRQYGIKVPQRIAQGYNLYASLIFFQRRHIPGPGHSLVDGLIPVLYLPTNPMVVVMVPCTFWPQQLLALWQQENDEA